MSRVCQHRLLHLLLPLQSPRLRRLLPPMHRRPIRKRFFADCFLLPLVMAWLVMGFVQAEAPEDNWASYSMAGQRVGYSHVQTESRETAAGKQWVKTEREVLRMKRLGTPIETEVQSTVV